MNSRFSIGDRVLARNSFGNFREGTIIQINKSEGPIHEYLVLTTDSEEMWVQEFCLLLIKENSDNQKEYKTMEKETDKINVDNDREHFTLFSIGDRVLFRNSFNTSQAGTIIQIHKNDFLKTNEYLVLTTDGEEMWVQEFYILLLEENPESQKEYKTMEKETNKINVDSVNFYNRMINSINKLDNDHNKKNVINSNGRIDRKEMALYFLEQYVEFETSDFWMKVDSKKIKRIVDAIQRGIKRNTNKQIKKLERKIKNLKDI